MKKTALFFLFVLFAPSLFAQAQKQMNAAEIMLGLKKLNTLGSALYIAAHPDDENTRLLSYLANEVGVRTGYLSLTRGDGGQNLIGTEQGELLGLIRTQELLAARRLDGAEQFFTRAYDFGYSKNPEETFSIWNKDSILSDVVWVIRKFRPDVIITRFPDDGQGGHGHHTASAILANEAFEAAGDPKRFPEQLKYMEIWKPKRIMWNHWGRWRNANQDLSDLLAIEVGQYNPLLGKSYGELAGESRTMHKSQGFGSAELRGSVTEYFQHTKGDKAKNSLFDGIETDWSRVDGGKEIGKLVDKAIADYDLLQPEKITPTLIEIYRKLQGRNDHYSKLKLEQVKDLIAATAGVYIDALGTDYIVSPGEEIPVGITLLNRSGLDVKFISTSLNAPSDYKKRVLTDNQKLNENELYLDTLIVKVPDNYGYTSPYWLREEMSKGRFTIKDKTEIGKPEDSNPLELNVKLNIAGETIEIQRPVQYKWVDPVKGEQYRMLEVAPAVTANFEQNVFIIQSNETKQVKVTLKSSKDNASGILSLNMPKGWKVVPAAETFELKNKGDEKTFTFTLEPQEGAEAGDMEAVMQIEGERISRGLVRIDHPHIPIQTYFPPADARVVPLDVKIKGQKVGYIPGAGDQIPTSLRNLGYEVEVLSDEMLANNDLRIYDAIVTGVRAYNTNDRMPFNYDKLMKYVENGGNLVVQYNTSNRLSSLSDKIGPYPFQLSRDRVTVEEADVTFALPNHKVLNSPNKITQKDFEGWIQERGLYFANQWDPKYVAPLEMNDPKESPSKGSLLIAQHGKGYFVYTGLSFFRELPAGVPGAYRLFANIVSLGK